MIPETDPAIVDNADKVKVSMASILSPVKGFKNEFEFAQLSLVLNKSFFPLFFPMTHHQTLVFCTGQIYYELLAEREKREVDDVALIRLEQIAPFAFDRVAENAAKYKNAEIIWAQQEPKYVQHPFVCDPSCC